mgnify:CR=1 FL=1
MGRGTHRGFITYEELSKSLGKRNLSDENLAQAFIHILDENVTLVEKKSDFKVLRKKENSNKEEGKTIEKSDDPIRMYLREMGGVELLSREGEIAIAKRIEAGKDVMLIALSQSPITAQQFFEWNEKLQKDEILVREIIDIDTNYMEDESTGPSAKQKNAGETDKEDGSSDEEDDVHSEIAQSMNQLSAFYSQSGKFAPAEVMARQALEMQESILGNEHPEYGATLLNLATVFVKQGRMTKAEPYATEALEVLEARLPDSHSSHIAALDRLGSVMLSTNKNEEARDTYNKALLLSQTRWGKDSVHTAASLIGLGLANLNCGDYRSSEKYLSIALDLLQHSPELDSTIEYSLLQQLACSYVFQLKLGDAVRLVPDSLRARHTANFNETIDTLNKVIDFVGSQVENVRK